MRLLRRIVVPGRLFVRRCVSALDAETASEEQEERFQYLSESVGLQRVDRRDYRVLVVHPHIRWGSQSAPASTTADLQLQEAVVLVKTLPNFHVTSAVIVGADYNTKRAKIFGDGRLDVLAETARRERANALMVNVSILSPLQQATLFSYFGLPIFDRYNVVLQIFKLFAKTKEALLQIELAEIPYIRHRLRCIRAEHMDPDALHINSSFSLRGDSLEVLRFREQSLRKRIKQAVEEKEHLVADMSSRRATTTVAVVGYTNAGKSSLINCLTGKSLYVEDRPFATLDSAAVFCRMPSGTPVLIADTIGFIYDLPMQLFASFQATLSHVASADLLVLVEDVSNPDRILQREVVMKTLKSLNVHRFLIDSIIFVGNKCDKLSEWPPSANDDQMISCISGRGLPQLISVIDKKIMSLRGRVVRRLKLRPSSEALPYLYAGSYLVKDPEPVDDSNFLLCSFVMDDAQFAKFRSRFGLRKKVPALHAS